MILKKLATEMYRSRMMHNYSQEQVAALIPMPQSSYSKIERALQEPSLMQLIRIAEILEFSIDTVLEIKLNTSAEDLALIRDAKMFIKNHSNLK